MAKINARGAREVARWEAIRATPADEFGPAISTRYLFVLRSDGKLLRRLAEKDLTGAYTVFATFKPGDNRSLDGTTKLTPGELVEARKFRVERMLTNKRYRWTPQPVRV